MTVQRNIGRRMITRRERAAMGSANRLKLGLFGANCLSGRAVTMVPKPVVTATKKASPFTGAFACSSSASASVSVGAITPTALPAARRMRPKAAGADRASGASQRSPSAGRR